MSDSHQEQSSLVSQEAYARIELAFVQSEFVLHYQPKVDLRDGRVIGVEALIRWQHPERGLLAPVHFLPLIEASPLVETLGRWVFESAAAQLDRWQGAGLDLSISINLAVRHFQSGLFVDELRSVMAKFPALRSGSLEVEVPEAAVLGGGAGLASIINSCHALGIGFTLDDFGTGDASLSCLRNIGADTLKIAPTFVLAMLDSRGDRAMVESIVGMARAFRRQVVAKGVETAAHCVALIDLGCNLGQGFGIARPMPPEELVEWLSGRSAGSGAVL